MDVTFQLPAPSFYAFQTWQLAYSYFDLSYNVKFDI